MTFIPTADYFMLVSRGNVTGQLAVLINGHNTAIGTTQEDIWEEGGTRSWLTAAETMNIASSSASDDGSPAGVGARTVFIEGLDGSWNVQSETVTMNGVTNVLTANSYLRINTMVVATSGSSETNVGIIRATASTAATVQSNMDVGHSISLDGNYSVPLGKTLFIVGSEFNLIKLSGSSPTVEMQAYVRKNDVSNQPWVQAFSKEMDTGTVNHINVTPRVYLPMVAQSDLRVVGTSDTANTSISVRLYGVLIDD